MDLDLIFNDLQDYIRPNDGKLDFHTELQKTACQCAKGAFVQDEWQGLLVSLLYHWKAEIKLSMYEAVDYMADVCGYATIGRDNFFSNDYGFWFILSSQYKELGVDESKAKGLYYMTIAIFETINYWCWHDAPVPITFDFQGLQQVLKFGNIQIDWDSYEKFSG